MQTSRRGFLAGLIALPAVALATKLALPSAMMAEEVREELIKDLHKKPVSIFDMRDIKQIEPVWASVSATSEFWAKEIIKQLQERLDRDVLAALYGTSERDRHSPIAQLPNMARQLARKIDDDLREQQVPVAKQLVVGIPKWDVVQEWGTPQIKISAGLQKHNTIWGDEYRVEHIRPTDLILPGLDKRGQAEFAGLILPS